MGMGVAGLPVDGDLAVEWVGDGCPALPLAARHPAVPAPRLISSVTAMKTGMTVAFCWSEWKKAVGASRFFPAVMAIVWRESKIE